MPSDTGYPSYPAELLPDHHWWMAGRFRALSTVLDRSVPQGGEALDVGSGTGGWAAMLATHFETVWLAEPDAHLHRTLCADGRFGTKAVHTSLPGPMPFRSGQFNLVSCFEVLEHIDDDEGAAGELHRVTAPGGRLFVTVPAHPKLWSSMDEQVGHRRRYTRAALRDLLVKAGFLPRLLAPFNVWLYPPAALMRRFDRVGDATPPRPVNLVLSGLLASEGRLAHRWPGWVRGLSWMCLAERVPRP